MKSSLNQVGVKKSRAFNRAISILGVSLITFAVCRINPNAISMIYAISGPLIAMILFIMPTLSTYLIPSLKPYRSIGNLLTLIVGVLCAVGDVCGLSMLPGAMPGICFTPEYRHTPAYYQTHASQMDTAG